MKVVRRRGKDIAGRRTRTLFRAGIALWLTQALVLIIAAALLVFSDGYWVYHFEQYRVVRGFMANPVEMIAVEALGTLCIFVGIFGVIETEGDLLDVVWAGYRPFFVRVCLLLLFLRGLFQPWWLFRREGTQRTRYSESRRVHWTDVLLSPGNNPQPFFALFSQPWYNLCVH